LIHFYKRKLALATMAEKEKDFKIVPECVEDVTVAWCNEVLHKGDCIPADVFVNNVKAQRLTNDSSDMSDGGGLSGSLMIKIVLDYSGNVTGEEPKSMVAKISGIYSRRVSFFWRFIFYAFMGGNTDEVITKREADFFQRIVPLTKGTNLRTPKLYFVGLDSKGDSSFLQYVLMNSACKIKGVILMEDLGDWKSFAPAEAMTKDDAKLCLKNISALHAKFWKDKKTIEESEPSGSDQDTRASYYSKYSYYTRKSVVNNIQKYVKNIKEGKWGEYKALRLAKGSVLPYWMTIGLSDDERYNVFEDPLVVEMFQVLHERYPEFNRLKAKEWVKRHPETVVHGDFHSGNHMFGIGENEGTAVVLDFQTYGKGLASNDFAQLINWSYDTRSYEEVEEFSRDYHMNLCINGVKDYPLEDFLTDVKIAISEQVLSLLKTTSDMKPETFEKMINSVIGEEKAQDFMKLIENGMFVKPILVLTSLYVKDKENFLIVKD